MVIVVLKNIVVLVKIPVRPSPHPLQKNMYAYRAYHSYHIYHMERLSELNSEIDMDRNGPCESFDRS